MGTSCPEFRKLKVTFFEEVKVDFIREPQTPSHHLGDSVQLVTLLLTHRFLPFLTQVYNGILGLVARTKVANERTLSVAEQT